jgi:putative tricarboxylic transport membrane protein
MGVSLLFGLICLVMVHVDWPRPPLILGLVLGSLIERNFFISYEIHAIGFLFTPIVLGILLTGLGVLFYDRVKKYLSYH